MVNVYINLTYLLHKELVHSLERINIFIKESSPSFAVY